MSTEQKVRPALSFSVRIDSADKREVDICGSVNVVSGTKNGEEARQSCLYHQLRDDDSH